MELKQVSAEVFWASGPIIHLNRSDIDMLKRAAKKAPKLRARINTHAESSDLLHEMIIAITDQSYIRPHRHINKTESFHMIEGEIDIVFFERTGNIMDVVSLSSNPLSGSFFYRLSSSYFHTLVLRSEIAVFHETTNGPFNPDQTEFGIFSPPQDNETEVMHYMNQIREKSKLYIK